MPVNKSVTVLRSDIINKSKPIIYDRIRAAKGEKSRRNLARVDKNAENEVWKLVSAIIRDMDDPVHFTFTGDTVNEKIDSIMIAISKGEVTPKQGETLMSVLRSGFEVTTMTELMGKLQEAGLIENTVV